MAQGVQTPELQKKEKKKYIFQQDLEPLPWFHGWGGS
jgi:hypothetical protein